MKKLLFLLPVFFLWAYNVRESGLSKKEKKAAISYLEETRDDLQATINGLSEDQFNFKPADDKWSVKECLQHIAAAEAGLWQMCDGALKAAANPEKRSEIKVSDEQLIKMMTDRSAKFQAPAELRPEKSPYATALDASNAFKASREKLLKYVKNTKDDMRNHVAQTPFGYVDAYQIVLFIGAHSNRHTQQMAEVLADPNFPK